MQVILTHENTDFDALASMLAATKLYPDATPIVPNRPNRNVRDFLTLYWDELPFEHFEDVPRPFTIQEIILVDTQDVPAFKGIPGDARSRIIDHHPMDPGLPANATFTGEELGATATSVVPSCP